MKTASLTVQPTLIGQTDALQAQIPLWARQWAANGDVDACLLSVRRNDVRRLSADDFETCVAGAFEELLGSFDGLEGSKPVRIWSFLPAIHQMMEGDRDRYMVFNAGRFAVLRHAFGKANSFADLPAASAVGHDGDDLVIHCLAVRGGGRAIENPRQIPAFQYSDRYGRQPPCFARGTVVQRSDRPFLIAAGTASIVGEQSVHPGDLPRQMSETLSNLQSLLGQARAVTGEGDLAVAPALHAFTDIRAYYPRLADAGAIEGQLRAVLAPRTKLQLFPADLCRDDLLVEIEGLARLGRRGAK